MAYATEGSIWPGTREGRIAASGHTVVSGSNELDESYREKVVDNSAESASRNSQSLDTEALVTRVLEDVRDLPMHDYNHTSQIRKRALDTKMLREAAQQQGLRVNVLSRYLQILRSRSKAVGFFQNMSSHLTLLERTLTHDKLLTKRILTSRGIPVASGGVASTLEDAFTLYHQIGPPAVVKPIHGSGGRGVTVGIGSDEELRFAAEDALSRAGRILIEEMVFGVDIRVMTIAGEAVAVTLRVPANVLGDGSSTIRELVEAKNAIRAKNIYLRSSPIEITAFTERFLAGRGFTPESVPAVDERVFLHFKANISSGGDSYELIDRVHPGLLRMAEKTAECFPSAGHAGVDLLVSNLNTDPQDQTCIVCEVNLNNELPLHIFPAFGISVNTDALAVEAYLGSNGAIDGDHKIDLPIFKRYNTNGRAAKGNRSPDSLIAGIGRQPTAYERMKTPATSARKLDQQHLRRALNEIGEKNISFPRNLIRTSDETTETFRHRAGSTVFTRELGASREALRELARITGLASLERVVLGPGDLSKAQELIDDGGRWRVRALAQTPQHRRYFYVSSRSRLERKWKMMPSTTHGIVMERVATGPICALLLLEGEVLATVLREPATVIGDGRRTLEALLGDKVKTRSQHPYLQHMPIKGNLITERSLANRGLDIHHVPEVDTVIPISRASLTKNGSDTYGLVGQPYPRLRAAARRLSRAMGNPMLIGVNFALAARTSPGSKTPSWVLSDIDADPVVSEFAFPWAGHPAAAFEPLAQALMRRQGVRSGLT